MLAVAVGEAAVARRADRRVGRAHPGRCTGAGGSTVGVRGLDLVVYVVAVERGSAVRSGVLQLALLAADLVAGDRLRVAGRVLVLHLDADAPACGAVRVRFA